MALSIAYTMSNGVAMATTYCKVVEFKIDAQHQAILIHVSVFFDQTHATNDTPPVDRLVFTFTPSTTPSYGSILNASVNAANNLGQNILATIYQVLQTTSTFQGATVV